MAHNTINYKQNTNLIKQMQLIGRSTYLYVTFVEWEGMQARKHSLRSFKRLGRHMVPTVCTSSDLYKDRRHNINDISLPLCTSVHPLTHPHTSEQDFCGAAGE